MSKTFPFHNNPLCYSVSLLLREWESNRILTNILFSFQDGIKALKWVIKKYLEMLDAINEDEW